MIIAAAVLAALLVLAPIRVFSAHSLIRKSEGKRPLGTDGIVIGGEGFVLSRPGAPALLLIHGAGDTPQTLRYLADALYAEGFHVVAPLLPGHGRTIREFSRITADDLTAAVRTAYAELKSRHEWVAVIGLSMGGALAVQLAAEHRDLPALGLAAPYLDMPKPIARAAALGWLWGVLVPFLPSNGGVSVLDPEERMRSLAYGVFTPAALRALRNTVRRAISALPLVTAPTLVIQSREDNRISSRSAERAFALLGARDKHFEWTAGAAHIITVDYGRERVFAALIAWMQARAPVSA